MDIPVQSVPLSYLNNLINGNDEVKLCIFYINANILKERILEERHKMTTTCIILVRIN